MADCPDDLGPGKAGAVVLPLPGPHTFLFVTGWFRPSSSIEAGEVVRRPSRLVGF